MPLDPKVKIIRTFGSARGQPDGSFAKTLIYEFLVGNRGPFREEFFANEQTAEAICFRINEQVRLLRATGALEPEGG